MDYLTYLPHRETNNKVMISDTANNVIYSGECDTDQEMISLGSPPLELNTQYSVQVKLYMGNVDIAVGEASCTIHIPATVSSVVGGLMVAAVDTNQPLTYEQTVQGLLFNIALIVQGPR